MPVMLKSLAFSSMGILFERSSAFMSLTPFWLALQFLTRFPVPRGVTPNPAALGWSVVMYPLVALLIGMSLILLQGTLHYQHAAPSLAAGLLLTSWVLITGGLHIDGLADCVDAYVGGYGDAERSLKIMKDPCSGPMAVAAVVLLMLLKFSALTALFEKNAWLPLLFTPVIGRSFVAVILLATPYVRSQGLGSPLIENLPRRPVMAVVAFSAFCVWLALGPWPLLAAILMVWVLRSIAVRRIGGCTGDVLGAMIEISEATALVVCALTLA
jgi:adenosylcobinamide-GDP ribazoletransferase